MIKKSRPMTAGTRHRKTLVRSEITKTSPEKSLTSNLKGSVGRSNGRVSVRHRQRGHKKNYRMIDFKRNKLGIKATVASIEFDPNRGPNVALIHYADGEKSYILAPEGLKVGMTVMSGPTADISTGNSLPLENIPQGVFVHNIEINPGRGGQVARGAGNSAIILAKEGSYVTLKLPSGEVKKFQSKCYATVGTLGNMDLRHARHGKAGIARHLGRRPHVRGVAMANPAQHPHAGSYKDNGIGLKSPKSPWGWKTLGKKTRSRKNTSKYIVKDRRKK